MIRRVPGDDVRAWRRPGATARAARQAVVPRVVLAGPTSARALEYLHTRQPPVIHRDIKPRNIKLGAHGRAVLLDFGLARPSDEISRAAYTLRYAPLEQVRGQVTDMRADLFALGATLYELLARKSPIDAVERSAMSPRVRRIRWCPLRRWSRGTRREWRGHRTRPGGRSTRVRRPRARCGLR